MGLGERLIPLKSNIFGETWHRLVALVVAVNNGLFVVIVSNWNRLKSDTH